MLVVSTASLIQSLETKRWELDTQAQNITYEIKDLKKDDNTLGDNFELTLNIFQNPHRIWDLDNKEMRYLLIQLLFNWSLEYKKNQGLWTPDSPLPMQVNAILCSTKSTMGELDKTHLGWYRDNLSFRVEYKRK